MNNIQIQKIIGHRHWINLEKLEKIFFALFLLSIPIQTRLTFYTPQTYLNGAFNEYATFFLYFSDILLIITLLSFFVNILTFKRFSSLIKHRIRTSPHLIPIFFVLITLITWSLASIFWSVYKNMAFYQSIKMLEFALLFLYIQCRLQWFGFNKFVSLIFIAGFLESLIGITQYYLQKSLGLRILMESVLSPETPNVAKIVVDGERIIRTYGTFPHPNVFSGFLILSIFCGIYLLFCDKTLKTSKIASGLPAEATISKIVLNLSQKNQIVSRETISALAKAGETILYGFIIIGIIIQLTAFILTFSRTAWLTSILIIPIYIYLLARSKLFHVKQFTSFVFKKTTIILIFSIIIPLLIIINANWKQVNSRTNDNENKYQQSVDNRVLYNDIAINMINHYPITGIGGKNYTIRMQEFGNDHLESWQFQPVHNIYLLITSEIGIIGLFLFILLIYSIIKTSWLNIKTKIASCVPINTNMPQTMLNLKQKNQIVSRLPAEASANKNINNLKRNSQIVSRETISALAKAGETISAEKNINEALLLQLGLTSIFAGFLFIGLLDHYFWTLQQGQLTFWIVLGAIASFKE